MTALITIKEACEKLNEGLPENQRVAEQFIRQAIRNGSFPGSYSGDETSQRHKYIIPRGAFEDYLNYWRCQKGNEEK